MQTNRRVDPAERLEDICREFTEAALSDKKPIILKIDFSVDQRIFYESIQPNKDEYHLIAMNNTREYVALRRQLGSMELRNNDLGLAERLKVAYCGQTISHSDFALDGQPSKVMTIYNSLAKGTQDDDPMSADVFPRFIPFMPTESMLNPDRKVHWSRDRFILGHVGDLEVSGATKKILLEEIDIYRASSQVARMRSELLSPDGTYLIVRPCVHMPTARETQKDFREAVISGQTRPTWAKLRIKVYSRHQLSVAERKHDVLPMPFSAMKLTLVPESSRQPTPVTEDNSSPQIRLF